MVQDGRYVNLGDPLNSAKKWYAETSLEEQGCANDSMEVGLIYSTLKTGKQSTWGRD